jgi:hypothetical protein
MMMKKMKMMIIAKDVSLRTTEASLSPLSKMVNCQLRWEQRCHQVPQPGVEAVVVVAGVAVVVGVAAAAAAAVAAVPRAREENEYQGASCRGEWPETERQRRGCAAGCPQSHWSSHDRRGMLAHEIFVAGATENVTLSAMTEDARPLLAIL